MREREVMISNKSFGFMQENMLDKTIKKAKKTVEKHYDSIDSIKRKWLELKGENSYKNKAYEVNVFVREGSPPKGYVIAIPFINKVSCFNGSFKRIKTYKIWDG